MKRTALPVAKGVLQRQCACGQHTGGGECGNCSGRKSDLQRDARVGREGFAVPSLVHEVLRGPGELLASDVGQDMARRFGTDLSGIRPNTDAPQAMPASLTIGPTSDPYEREAEDTADRIGRSAAADSVPGAAEHGFAGVRVHTGSKAALSAQAMGARAYTVGRDIVFGDGQFAPQSGAGRRLLAHELTHVLQQSASGAKGSVQRNADPAITKIEVLLSYSMTDWAITDDDATQALDLLKALSRDQQAVFLSETKFVDRLRDNLPTARVKELDTLIAEVGQVKALRTEKTALEAATKPGSGKSFGEVGSGFAKLTDVSHDLSVLETGTGLYQGNQCATPAPAGVTATDCTEIVLEVLEKTFVQQGRAADWDKVKKKMRANTKKRGAKDLSGLDLQAALQSEAGWKGIYWAPDPGYQIPAAELSKANSDEASYSTAVAQKKGTYYKDFGKKGYPGVAVSQTVTNYAPEAPNAGFGAASTTVKDTSKLDKLKKLPFGILAAHGGHHMTIITYGKVIEVHWDVAANSVDVIQQTDLEKWAVGPSSGYHYFASGSIVAPASDVDAAFK